MLRRHAAELAASFARQPDAKGATVGGVRLTHHELLLLEHVGDAGDVAAGHHHALRQLAHLETVRRAVELRHQVEARQGRAEYRALSPCRTCVSMRLVQASSRSHSRSDW